MSLFHAQSQLMLPKSGELGTEAEMFFFFFPPKHRDSSCGLITPPKSKRAERGKCRRQACTWRSRVTVCSAGGFQAFPEVLGGGYTKIDGLASHSLYFSDSETGHHRIY